MKVADLHKHIKHADLWLAGGLLLLALSFLIWIQLYFGRAPGAAIAVSLSGQQVGIYSLAEDSTLEFDNNGYHNVVVIANGEAYIREASCPDQYCVQHDAVNKTGQSLICLPAQLVVTVLEDESGVSLDEIAR